MEATSFELERKYWLEDVRVKALFTQMFGRKKPTSEQWDRFLDILRKFDEGFNASAVIDFLYDTEISNFWKKHKRFIIDLLKHYSDNLDTDVVDIVSNMAHLPNAYRSESGCIAISDALNGRYDKKYIDIYRAIYIWVVTTVAIDILNTTD